MRKTHWLLSTLINELAYLLVKVTERCLDAEFDRHVHAPHEEWLVDEFQVGNKACKMHSST